MQNINESFSYKGHFGCDSQCQIQIYKTNQDEAIAIATELDSNPGTSITNAYPSIFHQACQKYNLDPNKTRWFEQYPENDGEPSFSEVHQEPKVRWSHIPQEDLKQVTAHLIESDRS